MAIESLAGLGRLGVDIARGFDTESDIETQLTDRFAGMERTFETYTGEQVTISVQDVTVRPKYRPQAERSGIHRVDSGSMFTQRDTDRDSATPLERLLAVYWARWVTVATLRLEPGGLDEIRPPGLNIKPLSTRATGRGVPNTRTDGLPNEITAIPAIREAPGSRHQSERLEAKIPYDGSIAPYKQRLAGALDFLERLQEQMEKEATLYLLDLHQPGVADSDETVWADPKRARELADYLFEDSVDLEILAEYACRLKDHLTSGPSGARSQEEDQ
jgi:hypothetical protein